MAGIHGAESNGNQSVETVSLRLINMIKCNLGMNGAKRYINKCQINDEN